MDISKGKKLLPVMWAAAICGLMCTCLVTNIYAAGVQVMKEESDQPFHYCFSAFLAAVIYITCKVCFDIKKAADTKMGKGFAGKALAFLGGAVFGTYLTHMFFLDVLYYRIIPVLTGAGINKMAAAYIFTFAIMVLGMIAARVMKLIPGVKKLL